MNTKKNPEKSPNVEGLLSEKSDDRCGSVAACHDGLLSGALIHRESSGRFMAGKMAT